MGADQLSDRLSVRDHHGCVLNEGSSAPLCDTATLGAGIPIRVTIIIDDENYFIIEPIRVVLVTTWEYVYEESEGSRILGSVRSVRK